MPWRVSSTDQFPMQERRVFWTLSYLSIESIQSTWRTQDHLRCRLRLLRESYAWVTNILKVYRHIAYRWNRKQHCFKKFLKQLMLGWLSVSKFFLVFVLSNVRELSKIWSRKLIRLWSFYNATNYNVNYYFDLFWTILEILKFAVYIQWIKV